MKLLLMLLFSTALQAAATTGFAQSITINEKNAPLEKILRLIRVQSGYDFMYDKDLLNAAGKVDLQVKNVTVEQAMEKCLAGLPLSFFIDNKMIVIKKKEAQPAQQRADSTVRGRVTDHETGENIIGASIIVKGSNARAVTDQEGRFTIAASRGATVSVSFIGYEKKEVTITGPSLEVYIQPTSAAIREVVVTGYGEVRRRDLTGAIGSVKMADFQKAPVRSFEEALAGRVAGVQVSSSDGQPGADMKIVIRGNNSVTQDNSPLYVIDGFPMESPDNNAINPAEITSIEVLKDASATAIYGARGANGVVIITTRKGKEGPPVITYNGYYGIQQNLRQMELMAPYEFVKYQLERDSVLATAAYLANGKTLEDYRNVKGLNLQDEIFGVQPMQNHFISITGGTKTTRYAISGSLLNQDGVIVNTGYNRYQGRFNLEQDINKHFKVGINANLSHLNKFGTSPATGRGAVFSTNLMYSVWGYRPVSGGSSDLLEDDVDDVVDPLGDFRFNPITSAENEHRRLVSDITMVNVFAEHNIGKHFKLRITGGMTKDKVRREAFNNSRTPSGSPKTQAGKNYGINGSVNFVERNSYLNENTITFNKQLGRSHRINAVAGFTVQQSDIAQYGHAANQVPNEALGIAGLREGTPVTVNSEASSSALASFLGRVNYTFRDKYLLTASMRADGSSRFSDGNKWGYFPSGSVAWRLSEENFMKGLRALSNAKLRLSYGVTGNNRVDDFAYLSAITLPAATAYSFDNQPVKAAVLSELGTQSLQWESTSQTNLGLDLGFFNQRFTLEVDAYKKVTSNLLLDAKVPTSMGFSNAFKNIGKVENAGLEFTFNADILSGRAFTWNTSFNIAFNKNRLLQLADNQTSLLSILSWNLDYSKVPLYIAEIGAPIAQLYGYTWEGNYQYSDFDETSPGVYVLKDKVASYRTNRALTQPGDIKYQDRNNDGVVNTDDRTVIGDPNPDYLGGFSNNFSWKGFDLNVFFQYSVGQDVFNANRIIFEGGGRMHQNMFATYLNRWTPDNQNNTYFRTNGLGPADFGYSSRLVEDGSYLRLKTVALGYNFPQKLLKRIRLSSLRVYASAQNLFTWTNYSGFDPEVSAFESALTPGFDYSVYPRARTITFGLNLTL
ncbi:TonB-dependent receptor [Chitinophaga alhagiae]|uniref:TonB-dependent receptor n=1 Tax=Chitinophaga alhagiae TaxID=2203219 RepID=UPI000E5BEB5F|nr:TonB-dependent receptor [Chitinophaga alhagiae]